MATATATVISDTAGVQRRQFSAAERNAMVKAGILAPDEGVILQDGLLLHKHGGGIRLFNVHEYYALAEAGIIGCDERVELLDGEIVTMAAIGNRHAFCVRWLMKALVIALGDRAVLDTQNPVRLDNRNQPQPDLMILRWQDDGYQDLPGPADVLLVIEVADTSAGFDRRYKAPLYARHGIPEMWLFDLNRRQVEIYTEPSPGGYGQMRIVGMDGLLTPAAFPHIAIAVADALPQ